MLTRRSALLSLLAVPVVAVTELSPPEVLAVHVDVGNIPPDAEGALFKVVRIYPTGSGMDWQGHLGQVVTHGARCCANCVVIFATLGDPYNNNKWEVGFLREELEPLNAAAQTILDDIAVFDRERFPMLS